MSDYKLVFGLHLCERILSITDNLSKTLQGKALSAAEGQVTAQATAPAVVPGGGCKITQEQLCHHDDTDYCIYCDSILEKVQ